MIEIEKIVKTEFWKETKPLLVDIEEKNIMKKDEKIKIKSRWGDEYEHTNPSNGGWKIILAFLVTAVVITLICKCA